MQIPERKTESGSNLRQTSADDGIVETTNETFILFVDHHTCCWLAALAHANDLDWLETYWLARAFESWLWIEDPN